MPKLQLPPWLAGNPRRQAVAGGGGVLALILLIATLAVAGAFSGGSDKVLSVVATPTPTPVPATPTPTPTPPPSEPTRLNGRLVYPEELSAIEGRLPLAVMFDNFIEARPQHNISQADVVFEVVAEGGITRFLGVFWTNDPGPVLAVRSARAYYLPWAAEFDGIYVHWGRAKSPNAAADVTSTLESLGLRHYDGFFSGPPYFDRSPDRLGPHDGIAYTDALWQAAESDGWTGPPEFEPWPFKDDEPRGGGEDAAPTIDIGFGGPFFSDYAVTWTYDPETNGYARSQGGFEHVDGTTGERIEARNVAVMVTSTSSAGDGTAHLVYDTTGSGDAVVFQDGVAIPGAWAKEGPYARTRFYDAAGNEIAFNRGHTWIEVLSYDDPLSY